MIASIILAGALLSQPGPGEEPPPAESPPPIERSAESIPAALQLFLAPDGSDAASGLDPGTAVRTLARAQEILAAAAPLAGPAELRFASGVYEGQTVCWTFTSAEHPLRFLPAEDGGAGPIFDGAGRGGTWFTLDQARGEASNLVFARLEIRNYITAISLEGYREEAQAFNGGNVITDCVFRRIGNLSAPNQDPSYAVIRLVNSDDNLIDGNDFIDIENVRDCRLLHAVYIAHHSERNRILNNRFENHCGDPIRLRDSSNDNLIAGNLFLRAGKNAGYTEWYCNRERNSRCTKRGPECPSWNNVFRDNVLMGDRHGRRLREVKLWESDDPAGCDAPDPGARRVLSEGNRRELVPR